MYLAVVFDFLIPARFHLGAVAQHEAIAGIGDILLPHQHPLEGLGVEAEGGAALEALPVGVEVDILEVLVIDIAGDVDRLGNTGIHPGLGRCLHIHVLPRRDVVGGDEVVRQGVRPLGDEGRGLRVHQVAIGQQLVGIHLHFFLAFLALANHVAGVLLGESRLYAIAGIVGQGQGDGAGGGDGAVMGEAAAVRGQLVYQFRVHLCYFLHVAAVTCMQYPTGEDIPCAYAVLAHLRAPRQHGLGHRVILCQCRGHAFLLGQFQAGAPAGQGQFTGRPGGEFHGPLAAVFQAQHRQGGAQAQETHAVAALAGDLRPLAGQGQAVDLHHVVQHAGEYRYQLPVVLPIEVCLLSERLLHETGEVDRAQQAGAVGGQWLFSAVVRMQAIGIEGVDAGHLDIVNVFHAVWRDCAHLRHETFAVGPALIAVQQGLQASGLVGIGKADETLKLQQVCAADNQFVLGASGIIGMATPAIGEIAGTRLATVLV